MSITLMRTLLSVGSHPVLVIQKFTKTHPELAVLANRHLILERLEPQAGACLKDRCQSVVIYEQIRNLPPTLAAAAVDNTATQWRRERKKATVCTESPPDP